MAKRISGLTRRDFLRRSAGATLAGAMAAPLLAQEAAAPRSRVVLVRDPAVVDEAGNVNAEIIARMLDDAVKALLEQEDAAAAWKALFKPDDTVGIKTNVWRFLRTPEALEVAMKARLLEAGVPEERISIKDRGILEDPIFTSATAFINTRPMRTHHWSGVGSLIKNYIMFSPQPSSWHDDSCANLAGVWDLPVVKGKTRLNVLVMLTPLFHGKGPQHFQPEYVWPYKGLLVSADPVAADATGLRILEAKRRAHFGTEEPFAIPPKHIRVAEEKFGLGVADPARIDLVKLGWDEDILV